MLDMFAMNVQSDIRLDCKAVADDLPVQSVQVVHTKREGDAVCIAPVRVINRNGNP
jgi:hypothetical protein